MLNPKERFSDRVADYKKYRPGYPKEIIDYLTINCQLDKNSVIADVGSGTGIFTKMLLDAGLNVTAVEPNDPMRMQAEEDLKSYTNFTSLKGSAEELPLNASSVNLITVCQAFHWFDMVKCKIEFKRVLMPGGFVALIWNDRLKDTPFLIDFENLLKNNLSEFNLVDHKNITIEKLSAFFSPNKLEIIKYPLTQVFDYEGLKGRAQSSSYVPKPGTEENEKFFAALDELFDKHNIDNKVEFHYDSTLYLGKL